MVFEPKYQCCGSEIIIFFPDPALGLISDPDPACFTKVIRLYKIISYKIFSHQLKFELQII